jgi:hypothetical protein
LSFQRQGVTLGSACVKGASAANVAPSIGAHKSAAVKTRSFTVLYILVVDGESLHHELYFIDKHVNRTMTLNDVVHCTTADAACILN